MIANEPRQYSVEELIEIIATARTERQRRQWAKVLYVKGGLDTLQSMQDGSPVPTLDRRLSS